MIFFTEDREKKKASRKKGINAYAYGFNGKEKDDEVKGSGNSYDFGARVYDPRIGRFSTIDPLHRDSPNQSPYLFGNNRPIDGIDENGEKFQPYWWRIFESKAVKQARVFADITGGHFIHINRNQAFVILDDKSAEFLCLKAQVAHDLSIATGQDINHSDITPETDYGLYTAIQTFYFEAGNDYSYMFAYKNVEYYEAQSPVAIPLPPQAIPVLGPLLGEVEVLPGDVKAMNQAEISAKIVSEFAKDNPKKAAREAAKKKRAEQPASEDYAKYKARELEKAKGKDARREAHDKKDKKAGRDRTKEELDEDYN